MEEKKTYTPTEGHGDEEAHDGAQGQHHRTMCRVWARKRRPRVRVGSRRLSELEVHGRPGAGPGPVSPGYPGSRGRTVRPSSFSPRGP